MKKCEKCNCHKDLDFYDKRTYKSKKSNQISYYYSSICKECRKRRDVEYNKNNKDMRDLYNKNYNISNKIKISKTKKEYYDNNRDKIRKSKRVYMKKRRKEDIIFKLKDSISSLIYHSIRKQGYSKHSHTSEILGCDFNMFKTYIEKQFKEGMSWENHGLWHLDHIKPISLAKTEEQVYELNTYINFQPLWAFENTSKGNNF